MRKIVAVVGNREAGDEALAAAVAIGRGIVDAGFRLATGGLGGVMEAASRGAHASPAYREGDVIGVLPGADRASANRFVDVAIPTNMGYARNVLLVSMADAIVAIGGGAGTLTEIAMAWQLDRPIVAFALPGWSGELGGKVLDQRARRPIIQARSVPEANTLLSAEIGAQARAGELA